MRLEEVFAAVLKVPPDTIEDGTSPKTHHRWSSLRHVEIIARLEQAFKVRFSNPEIAAMTSVGAVREILGRKGVDA